jgi:head-tail adaptor
MSFMTFLSRNLHFHNLKFLETHHTQKCQNLPEAVEPKRSSRHEVADVEHKQSAIKFCAQNENEMKPVTANIKLRKPSSELHVSEKNDFEDRGNRMPREDEEEGEADSWVMAVSSMRVVVL